MEDAPHPGHQGQWRFHRLSLQGDRGPGVSLPPHVPEEFVGIPADPAAQTEMTMENLRRVLSAAGGELTDIVQLIRFIVDQEHNQDATNRVMAKHLGDRRAASTSVEVVPLATDPRLVLELQAIAMVP